MQRSVPAGRASSLLAEPPGEVVGLGPDDLFAAEVFGAAGALNAGITTVLDRPGVWLTPEHQSAVVRALKSVQIRAVVAGDRDLGEYLAGGVVSCAVVLDDVHPGSVTAVMEQARASSTRVHVRAPRHPPAGWLRTLDAAGVFDDPNVTHLRVGWYPDHVQRRLAGCAAPVVVTPSLEARTKVRQVALPPVLRGIGVGSETVAADLFSQMRAALDLSQIDADGGSRGPTAREVLAWATIGSARALGIEKLVGTIEAGKQADLTLIELSTISSALCTSAADAVVLNAAPHMVTDVYIAGRAVKRDGTLMDVDVASITEAAAHAVLRTSTPKGHRT